MDHSEVKHLPKVDHTPAEMDDASRLLLDGASYLECNGWYPGDMDGHLGRAWCAQNTLVKVSADERTEAFNEASRRLWTALGGTGCGAIWKWNDAPGRTKQEVVAKLRAVALGL